MSDPAARVDPHLVLIAALATNGVIGREGALPWRLPEDLKRFRRLTMGKTVLMGRKTFDSLGKPLAGRRNWVLTRTPRSVAAHDEVAVFADLEDALAQQRNHHPHEDLMVIGGADLYRQLLPRAARLELTEVAAEVEGDAHFPPVDPRAWRETASEQHAPDERHAFGYRFVTLTRADAAG